MSIQTIQEIEAKIERDYAGVFRVLNSRTCSHCGKQMPMWELERIIILNAITSAYLAGQSKGLQP